MERLGPEGRHTVVNGKKLTGRRENVNKAHLLGTCWVSGAAHSTLYSSLSSQILRGRHIVMYTLQIRNLKLSKAGSPVQSSVLLNIQHPCALFS